MRRLLPGRKRINLERALDDLFEKGMSVRKAHGIVKKKLDSTVTFETCNEFFVKFRKRKNDIVREEREFEEAKREYPGRRISIMAPIRKISLQKQQRNEDASLKREIRNDLKKLNLEGEAEERMDPVAKLSEKMINKVLSESASIEAAKIVELFRQKTLGKPLTQETIVINIYSYTLNITVSNELVCNFKQLPLGCEYSTSVDADFKYYKKDILDLSMSTLVELFKLTTFEKTKLRFKLGVPVLVDKRSMREEEDYETTKALSCDFMEAFALSRNLMDTTQTKMVIIMNRDENYEFHDRIEDLMSFTNLWLAKKTRTNVKKKLWVFSGTNILRLESRIEERKIWHIVVKT
ncbi:unnamed protein product [Caenorhabditis brenneri]